MITQPTLINGKIELIDGKGVTSMVQEYSNILVPLDGSQQAEIALDKAVAVAKRNEAHIDVLAVIDPGQFGYNLAGLADGDITYQLVQDSEAYLKETVDKVNQDGFTDIAKESEAKGAKNIVIVSHGMTIGTFVKLAQPELPRPHGLDNGSVTHLTFEDGKFTIGKVGDMSYREIGSEKLAKK